MSLEHLRAAMIDPTGVSMDMYLEETATREIIDDIEAYANERADKGAIRDAIDALNKVLAQEKDDEPR